MVKKRIAALENKILADTFFVMFTDSVILEADALKYKLPFDITIEEVLKLKPGIGVIHFDEMGELVVYGESNA